MATRIPTLLADGSLQAPTFSSAAEPTAFGYNEGLNSLARGIGHAAGAVSDLQQANVHLQKQRSNEIDERWVGDSFYAERNHLNEWQADPKNNSSEEFGKNFKAYAESRLEAYKGKAPSKKAEAAFNQNMQAFIGQRYGSALVTSERTRVENTKDSILSQTSLALGTYRGSGEVPNVEAKIELVQSHLDLHGRIESLYQETDPELRRKLGAYIDSEFALAVGASDPEIAKGFVTASSDLEEHQKVTLLAKLELMQKDVQSVGRDDFNRFRADLSVLQKEGTRKNTIPIEDYLAYYDKDTAARLKADDDSKARVYNSANEGFAELSGTNIAHQNRVLSERKEKLLNRKDPKGAVEDDMALRILADKLQENQELQTKDPVAWLARYNPEVTESVKKVMAAPVGATVDSVRAKNLSLLKFQGPAPIDATDPERYLNIPQLDRRVMSLGEITKSQNYINQGTPPEVVKRINEVLAGYPGAEDIAFDNMTQGPNAIKQEYRLAWQNKNQEGWVQSFIGALGDSKALASLTDERKGAIGTEIDQNPTWKKFEQAMIGPDPTRANEIAGFKQGIMAYANYFSASQGKTMGESVNQAIDHLLLSTMGHTTVNGRASFIMKENPGKPDRTDEEIQDIGRRLGVALKDIDPRQIDQSKFKALAGFGPKDSIEKLQALRDQITRTGHFVPDSDGQSMLLYTTGDAGIPFPVTDKHGRPFMIKLDDLPKFTKFSSNGKTEYDLDMSPESLKKDPSLKYRELGPETPKKTYPLQEFPDSAGVLDRTLWHWGGIYFKSTYWPTNSGYWKNKGMVYPEKIDPVVPKLNTKLKDSTWGPPTLKPTVPIEGDIKVAPQNHQINP